MSCSAHGDSIVFVFSSDAEFRYATLSALEAMGLQTCGSDALADARAHAQQSALPLLVLAEAPQVLARVCRDLRSRNAAAGIVAVAHYADVGQRVRLLQQGADVCLGGDIQVGELAAQLQALARRVGASVLAAEPPADPGWTMADDGWSLLCPDGTRLALSPTERTFMQALLAAPGARMPRATPGQPMGARRMDMIVSRLRSKAAGKGVALPVRTIRGWGYAFTGAT